MVKNIFLKLQEKSSGDIVYFEYDIEFEHSFPFIVVGFFEKLKKQVVGLKFIFGNTKLRFGENELDVTTGSKIIFELGEKWECIDLTIEENYYNLALLLKDKKGQKIAIEYTIAFGAEKLYDVFTEKEAEKYKSKFGLNIWNLLLEGNVKIGMTKEMCRIAWGAPKKINETITAGRKSEQWVYSDNYLYFENGKLTTIQ